MGMSGLEHITAGLLTGLPGDTPVALVQNASLPTQRQALTTLAHLIDTVKIEQLHSPCIVVVGNVVQVARAWPARPDAWPLKQLMA
jgi:uroporphyrin-III C-methyltransferase